MSDGEKFVFSLNIIEGKEAVVVETLRKMFDTDPDFVRVELAGSEFWKYAPQQGGTAAGTSVAKTATRPDATRPEPTRPTGSPTAHAVNSAVSRTKRPTAATIGQPPTGPEAELIKGAVFSVPKAICSSRTTRSICKENCRLRKFDRLRQPVSPKRRAPCEKPPRKTVSSSGFYATSTGSARTTSSSVSARP